MQIDLWEDYLLGVLTAVADLYPNTGIVGAEIMVSECLDDLDEDEIDLDAILEGLVSRTVTVLARLGLVGEVVFINDVDPSSETHGAIGRVLANIPHPVIITTELCAEAQQWGVEEKRQTAKFLKRLASLMQEEGLRQGLNREEREKLTLGEVFLQEEQHHPTEPGS